MARMNQDKEKRQCPNCGRPVSWHIGSKDDFCSRWCADQWERVQQLPKKRTEL